VGVAVHAEEVDVLVAELVVPLVAGQGEVVGVGREAVLGVPVVVARTGPEAVLLGALAVLAFVRADPVVVELADVLVDGVGLAVWVVVVADGDDEVRLQPGDQGGDLMGLLAAVPEVPDHREAVQLRAAPQRRQGARADGLGGVLRTRGLRLRHGVLMRRRGGDPGERAGLHAARQQQQRHGPHAG
jgi:hypothetical protein